MNALEPYFLKHVTTEENCIEIKKSGKFIYSMHLPEKDGEQWLGNGIYFWDGNDNDDEAVKIQRRLVTKRKNNKMKRTAKIAFLIEVKKTKHMNLNNYEWEKKFTEFLKDSDSYPDGEQLFQLMEMSKSEKNVHNTQLKKIGVLFGTSINLFLDILSKEYDKSIDLVSYTFFHKIKTNVFYGNSELCLKQFCVKNEIIIPTKSKQSWKIEYI